MSFYGKPVEPPGFGEDGKYTVSLEAELEYNQDGLGYLKLTATCLEGPAAGKKVNTKLLVDGVAEYIANDPDSKLGGQLRIQQGVMATIIKLGGFSQPDSFEEAYEKFAKAIENNHFELKQATSKAGYKNYYYEKAIPKPARMVTGDPATDKAPAKVAAKTPAKVAAKTTELEPDDNLPF